MNTIKTSSVKKIDGKAEVTETISTSKINSFTLSELKQHKADLQKSKESAVNSFNDALAVHDEAIVDKQKQIDEAISLGIIG